MQLNFHLNIVQGVVTERSNFPGMRSFAGQLVMITLNIFEDFIPTRKLISGQRGRKVPRSENAQSKGRSLTCN